MKSVSSRTSFSSILLIIVAAVALVYGLMYCLIPKPMPYHLKFVGMSYEEIKVFSEKLAVLLMLPLRVAGVSFLAIGILLIGIALRPYRAAEKWAWFATVPALIIMLVPILVISIYVGGLTPIVASAVPLGLVVVAAIVPLKDFFN